MKTALLRHLVTLFLLLGACIAYVGGYGPLFFGAPLLGTVLVAAGIAFEFAAWWRITHASPPR